MWGKLVLFSLAQAILTALYLYLNGGPQDIARRYPKIRGCRGWKRGSVCRAALASRHRVRATESGLIPWEPSAAAIIVSGICNCLTRQGVIVTLAKARGKSNRWGLGPLDSRFRRNDE